MAKRVHHQGRVTRSSRPTAPLVARSGPRIDLHGAAGAAVQRARQRQSMTRLQSMMTVDGRVAQTLMQLGQQIVGDTTADEDGDGCRHPYGSAVDLAALGPDKVWRCDQCQWLYRLIDPGDGDPIMVGVE